MRIPDDHYLVFQPKLNVPSVFDLHARGMFKIRPSVSADWGCCIIADKNHAAKLLVLYLAEQSGQDPGSGNVYNWILKTVLIDLGNQLELDPAVLEQKLPDEGIRQAVAAVYKEWRGNWVPVDKKGKVRKADLSAKLQNTEKDYKESLRNDLLRRNHDWVEAALPRSIFDFRRGLYWHVADTLYEVYKENSGSYEEKELIKKIMTFNRLYENNGQDELSRPDGNRWRNEDEIWECWVGFAGSDAEAKCICRTMETVFRPLQAEMAEA